MSEGDVVRCNWAGSDPLYQSYHDNEWGYPVTDDIRLFEKLCLEGFQSGLSWLTILKKRENFRAAFSGFDIEKVAAFDQSDIERCLGDAGIVRHRGKIVSTINNARRTLEIVEEFGTFARYIWGFEPPADQRPGDLSWESLRTIAQTDASRALSKDLKKRGFSFVGPTTSYAFMQAMGLVNDHIETCFCRERAETARAEMARP